MCDPFDMAAGETLDIFVEMDYENRDSPRDFSVVAWGDTGELEIKHKKGLVSKTFKHPDEHWRLKN